MRHAFKDQCKSSANYRKLFAKAFSHRCFRPSGGESNRRNQDVKVDEFFYLCILFEIIGDSSGINVKVSLLYMQTVCDLASHRKMFVTVSDLRVSAGNKAVEGKQCVNVHS